MTNELQQFKFSDTEIRVVRGEDGEPRFVAKDIVEGIGATWTGAGACISHIPDEWKGVLSVHTPKCSQNMVCLTEQGVYFYLARSDKPKALPFQKWLAGEVLPSIRKHGTYMTPEVIEKTLTNPDFIIKLATELKQEQEKRKALETQAAIDRPKTIFADAVAESKTSILIGDLAKLIKQNGFDIGQKRLFEWLRSKGWLIKSGSSKNIPTQRAMEHGLFEVKERTINAPDGHIIISKTTKVTGKGQVYFVNKFLGDTTLPLVEPPLELEA